MLNQTEADLLVPQLITRWNEGGPALPVAAGEDIPALAVRGFIGGGFEMSLVAFLHVLMQLGPKYVIVTDGARGAFVGSRGELIFGPALKSKAVGTAGAGDAFGATLTAYLALGRPLEEAISAATINSASVIGYVDTQSGLLPRKVLDERVRAQATAIRRWPL
jgi:sugar/nucleoside kinase (ribokinase family)